MFCLPYLEEVGLLIPLRYEVLCFLLLYLNIHQKLFYLLDKIPISIFLSFAFEVIELSNAPSERRLNIVFYNIDDYFLYRYYFLRILFLLYVGSFFI